MSGDPEQEYFSDGMTEDLITDLSRLSGLFVIARTSTFTYKGKAVKVEDVGRELGVQYVLEGSVRKADNRVLITAQLVETLTGHHVWAERYNRPLQDLFALQEEVRRKIVAHLALKLTDEEEAWWERTYTRNPEAYDYLLRGLESQWRFTKEMFDQARQMYEKAIALDPTYAEAYAGLGWTYREEWLFQWSADTQGLERALALAHQALALDDSLPFAHALLGYVCMGKQQYDQAIAEVERAIVLDPNNADGYAFQADVLNFAGRPEEALPVVEQAMRLNPHYPFWYIFDLGWAYAQAGRYAEAIATLKEASSRGPNFLGTHNILALSYLWQWVEQQSPAGQALEPAVVAVQRTLALNDSYYLGHTVLGYISLYQQQYEQALAEMERAVALVPNEAFSYAALAKEAVCRRLTLSRRGNEAS